MAENLNDQCLKNKRFRYSILNDLALNLVCIFNRKIKNGISRIDREQSCLPTDMKKSVTKFESYSNVPTYKL